MSHPLFDLSNRVALVSGAASGLGKAMATGFAEAGADLVLADINADGLATTARGTGGLGPPRPPGGVRYVATRSNPHHV